MDQFIVLAAAFGIGVVAGLRCLTAPALVSGAAYLGWLNLSNSPFAFMGSLIAVIILTLMAVAEYVSDVLPNTPSRTAPRSLIARFVSGAFTGACLCAVGGQSLIAGILLGGIGAIAGTFGGYEIRKRLVQALGVKDIFVAIPEDLLAIALGLFLVTLK